MNSLKAIATISRSANTSARKIILIPTFIVLAVTTSCAYGPKAERKSPLNYLNGDHYNEKADIMGVPVLERKAVPTKISGQVLLQNDKFPIPLQHQTLQLKNEQKIFLTTMTKPDGTFELNGIVPDGTYIIELASAKYHGSTKVDVNSYEMKNILLTAADGSSTKTEPAANQAK